METLTTLFWAIAQICLVIGYWFAVLGMHSSKTLSKDLAYFTLCAATKTPINEMPATKVNGWILTVSTVLFVLPMLELNYASTAALIFTISSVLFKMGYFVKNDVEYPSRLAGVIATVLDIAAVIFYCIAVYKFIF